MNQKTNIRRELGYLAVIVVVLGNFAVSSVINSFLIFDPGRLVGVVSRSTDNHVYLALYAGKPLKLGTAFWNYRVVIPYMARLVPDLPVQWMFTEGRHFEPASLIGIKFASVNLMFLVATAIVLYFLVQGFGLTRWHGLAGGVLYLGMYEVAASSGQPMLEPGYFFCMALGALAVQRQNMWLLMGTTLIGVFAKEQVLLVIGLVVLAPYTWREKIKLLLAILPAIALYGMVRLWFVPLTRDLYASGDFLDYVPKAVAFVVSPLGIFGLLMTFGLLWLPIIYAVAHVSLPMLLKRWIWFVPLVFGATVSLGGGYEAHGISRHLSVTFIVGVPLALYGLSDWLGVSTRRVSAPSLSSETM